MRRIPPEVRSRGVTLIEMVVAMVVLAVIVGVIAYFVFPLRQSADLTVRADLTDAADNALQRIGRDVRLALPNSVRIANGGQLVEYIAIRTAGRYRSDGGGAASGSDCPDNGIGVPASDQLVFDVDADSCFKTLGTLPSAGSVAAGDFLVLNNYGPGFTNQNAYEAPGGASNRRAGVAVASEGTRERVSFTAGAAFDRTLHDSPGKRFFIVSGAVSYACSGSSLVRCSGYGIGASPPACDTTTGNLLAENVSSCEFVYTPNIAPQIGLLTVRLALSRTLSSGNAETVSLYHAIHVSNVP